MPTEYSVLSANQVIYIGPVPVWELNGSGQVTLARNGLASRATRRFAYYDVNFNALCAAIVNGGQLIGNTTVVSQSIYFPPVPGLVFKQVTFHKGDPSSINGLQNNIVSGRNMIGYQTRYFDIEFAPLDYSELSGTGQWHIRTSDYQMPVSGMQFASGQPIQSYNLLIPFAELTYDLKSVPFLPVGWIVTYTNTVNSTLFAPNVSGYAGFSAGTVIFKGMEENGPRQVFQQNNVQLNAITYTFNWDLSLNFQWLACGWNKGFNGATGAFETITNTATGNPPFTSANLNAILQQPNPNTAIAVAAPSTQPNDPPNF